jgi:hypothetical protein
MRNALIGTFLLLAALPFYYYWKRKGTDFRGA